MARPLFRSALCKAMASIPLTTGTKAETQSHGHGTWLRKFPPDVNKTQNDQYQRAAPMNSADAIEPGELRKLRATFIWSNGEASDGWPYGDFRIAKTTPAQPFARLKS